MSIYGSTNIYPDGISIDATSSNIVTWKYNGSGIQTNYQILIYLNSNNTLTYDSTKLTSSHMYHTVPLSTLTNGNTYKVQVITWDGIDTARSQWILFYCNSMSSLTLGTLPTSVQTYNFTCTYHQSQNVKIKTYNAFLYLDSDHTNVIDQSGVIYPSTPIGDNGIISWQFDGLESPQNYAVQFTAITQHDEVISTAITSFSILYNYPTSIPDLVTTVDNNTGTVTLDWVALVQKLGYTYNQSYSYVDGKFNKGLQLDIGNYLYYTEPIPEDFTLYFWVKIPLGYSGTLVKFGTDDNGMQIFFDINRFGWRMGTFNTVGRAIGGQILDTWTLIGVKYNCVIIKGENFQETISI